jgi:prephenate dehydrogenase
MAGSEQTGVVFAKADLFERALCLLTPTARTPKRALRLVRDLWETLGGRTMVLTPTAHDRLLARVSHLPHAVASALVHVAEANGAMDLAGPGFGDTTRIASGDAAMWTDIFRTNRRAMLDAIDRLMKELSQLRGRISRDDARALERWLSEGKTARDQWVARRYRKKVLTP